MRLQLVRNATLRLDYGGRTILIDPYLAPKHSLPSFTGRSPNPMADLPMPIEEVIADVDLVIISHLHADHFDGVAKERVPKDLPLICQPGDEETVRKSGFGDVTPLTDEVTWQGIRIARREGNHGSGDVLAKMGSVMGFTLRAPGEPSVYWTGDTIFYPPVLDTIKGFDPDVVVTHSCGALWDGVLIVMDAEQTVATCEAVAERTVVVATHMEALDHSTVDRTALRTLAEQQGIAAGKLLIPADGETLMFAAGGAGARTTAQ